eukprot:1154446-Pelagomonas_calceolata.AAC.1
MLAGFEVRKAHPGTAAHMWALRAPSAIPRMQTLRTAVYKALYFVAFLEWRCALKSCCSSVCPESTQCHPRCKPCARQYVKH